jgi:hypothetical protein
MPPDNFAAFILTHGRPEKVKTLRTLERSGYTGPVFLICDDEDPTLPEYRERYGDKVVTFSKADVHVDTCDNLESRRGVVYARNASFDIAERLGFRYFIQLDDDYTAFSFRARGDALEYGTWNIPCLDNVFGLLLEYFKTIPAASLCFCQGGDYIGGMGNKHVREIGAKRKAMNTFIFDTQRRVEFLGRVNEDVNMYVTLGRRGALFLTLMSVQIVQVNTQQSSGGMTEIYLDGGTYQKSFYSVMVEPSCVKIAEMGEVNFRVHHFINWKAAAPMIIRETFRK